MYLIFMAASTMALSANVSLGVDVGLAYSPLKNLNNYIESYDFKRIGFGADLGLFARYFLKENFALQGSISYYITKTSRDNEKVNTDLSGYHYVTSEYKLTATSLFLDAIWYPRPQSPSRFYFGGGLGIIPVKTSSTFGYKLDADDAELLGQTSSSASQTSFGGDIFAGLEHFINTPKTLAVIGELKIKYSDLKITADESEEQFAGFLGWSLLFGLNYYL